MIVRRIRGFPTDHTEVTDQIKTDKAKGIDSPLSVASVRSVVKFLTPFDSRTGCLCGWGLVIEGGNIPQFHGFVVAAGGEVFAVG